MIENTIQQKFLLKRPPRALRFPDRIPHRAESIWLPHPLIDRITLPPIRLHKYAHPSFPISPFPHFSVSQFPNFLVFPSHSFLFTRHAGVAQRVGGSISQCPNFLILLPPLPSFPRRPGHALPKHGNRRVVFSQFFHNSLRDLIQRQNEEPRPRWLP